MPQNWITDYIGFDQYTIAWYDSSPKVGNVIKVKKKTIEKLNKAVAITMNYFK